MEYGYTGPLFDVLAFPAEPYSWETAEDIFPMWRVVFVHGDDNKTYINFYRENVLKGACELWLEPSEKGGVFPTVKGQWPLSVSIKVYTKAVKYGYERGLDYLPRMSEYFANPNKFFADRKR